MACQAESGGRLRPLFLGLTATVRSYIRQYVRLLFEYVQGLLPWAVDDNEICHGVAAIEVMREDPGEGFPPLGRSSGFLTPEGWKVHRDLQQEWALGVQELRCSRLPAGIGQDPHQAVEIPQNHRWLLTGAIYDSSGPEMPFDKETVCR